MKRTLILGGYGGFGARLSRRLASDGWEVLIAGRNLAKAEALAVTLSGARGTTADRTGDLASVLAAHRPDLLIDAAGPFQTSDYHVVEACIAAGVHYCDLADARGFVNGIGHFDADARAAGVTIISGGSSVPALSGAVVRELSQDMAQVSLVEMSICTSAKVTTGKSVAEAALSYAGKPVRLWRGQRWVEQAGWHAIRREKYSVPGRKPIRHLVALADIPDYDIMPETLPGRPATIFRLGSDSALQVIALWLLAWLVKLGWMRSALGWARWLGPVQRLMARFGGEESAMAVEVSGYGETGAIRRRWTLLAKEDQGAEIPTLASQLVARRLRNGRLRGGLRSGAYDTSQLFTLADFSALFPDLAVYTYTETTHPVPAYRQVMGDNWHKLPAPVQAMHDFIGDSAAIGTGTALRGSSPLARLVGWIMRFPPAGEYDVHVGFSERGGTERWTRSFGPHRFYSELSADGPRIVERFGPLRFQFDLPVGANGLRMVLRRWTAFGVPMPLALAPKITASESVDAGDFLFEVAVALPLIGPVMQYHGRLRRVQSQARRAVTM